MLRTRGPHRHGKQERVDTAAVRAKLEKTLNDGVSAASDCNERSNQIAELATVSYMVRIILTRVNEGKITDKALKDLTPPPVRTSGPSGATEAVNFIRDTLVSTRQVISSLYMENVSLSKRVDAAESMLSLLSGRELTTFASPATKSMSLDEAGRILGELNLDEDLLEVSDE